MSPDTKGRRAGKSEDQKRVSRRTLLKGAAVGGSLTSLTGCLDNITGGGGSNTVKVGLLADRSGSISIYGVPMTNAAKMWRDNVNENGGLLGHEVELFSPDPQSDNQKYKNQAQQLILQEEVDVLMGGITSASREAIRPIVDDNKQLYFYPALYEGGVCDEFTWMTGPTPTQQVRPLVKHMVENYGENVYTLAADYNFGQISAMWAKQYTEDNGGSVVGEEFIPLSVSDFGSTINRIQEKDPDWIMSLLVGSNHVSFFKQAESTGLDIPMGTSVNIGASYEHKTLSPPALSGMVASWNYMEEIPTERNKQWVSQFREQFPDTKYINQHAQSQYVSMLLYEKAVRQVETTDMKEVNSTLEGGFSVKAPQGNTEVDPETHHLRHNIHLAEVQDDHSIEFLGTTKNVEPTWLQSHCSLASESTWDNPTTEMYTPN